MTHICVSKLTIIGSGNGLSPGRRQAIIWTNVGILLIQTLGTNFSEILGEIHSFSFRENTFENVICVIASIWSRPQWVKNCFETSLLNLEQSSDCRVTMIQHLGVRYLYSKFDCTLEGCYSGTFNLFWWMKLIVLWFEFHWKGPVIKNTTRVQVTACRQTDGKPLSRPMVAWLLKHLCITQPWCVMKCLLLAVRCEIRSSNSVSLLSIGCKRCISGKYNGNSAICLMEIQLIVSFVLVDIFFFASRRGKRASQMRASIDNQLNPILLFGKWFRSYALT